MTQSRTYTITDQAAIAARIKAAGGPAIDPTQPTGKASADGVTLMWTLASTDSGAENIMVTVVSKPWIVPYSTIWEHIGSVLN